MEEILASIRRIISEDEQPARKVAEEPLELSLPADPMAHDMVDDLMVFDAEPEPEPTPPPRPVPAPAAPAPAPVAVSRPAPAPETHFPISGEEESMLSEQAFAAASGSFTRLAGTMRIAGPGQTLEGIVREMLRPMLKEWLDENLPPLVEAKVEAEVQRITKGFR